MKRTTLLTLLSFLSTAHSTFGAGNSFPSDKGDVPNIDGQYAVVWREPNEKTVHQLLLNNRSTGKTELLLEFGRHVDVLWSPNVKHLAVTDWAGSDVAELTVFTPGTSSRANLADALSASLGTLPELTNHHVYFEALRWISDSKLLFKVFGYGDHDPTGFEDFFSFDVSGEVLKSTYE